MENEKVNVFEELDDMMNVGDVVDVELFFDKLYKEADEKEQWTIRNLQAELYERHHMYLKMDKIGKMLCDTYPANYQGYHIRYQAMKNRNKIPEMELILNQVPEETKTVFPYLIDWIECLEIQNKYEEIIEYVSKAKFYSEEAECYAWKQATVAFERLQRYEEAEQVLKKIAVKYGDFDAIIAVALLFGSRQEFDKTRDLANLLLQNTGEEDVIYAYYAKTLLTVCDMISNEDDAEKYNKAIDELILFIKDKKLPLQEQIEDLKKCKKV